MEFTINNLNIIRKAKITIDGLTVIVGENSSGKSTIARTLFSTIKALNESAKSQTDDRMEKIKKNVDSLYKHIYSARGINDEIESKFPLPSYKFLENIVNSGDFENTAKDILEFLESIDIPPRVKQFISNDLTNIVICFDKNRDRKWLFAAEIQNLIESEFINSINQTESAPSKIEFKLDDENFLRYSIQESQLHTFALEGENFLEDATYIESPLYIHILDSLLRASPYKETSRKIGICPMLPAHIIDFANKIDSIKYFNTRNKVDNNDINLSRVVGGYFYFDRKTKKLIFKYNGMSISPINVASGIKSFGVIQMLLDANYINENKILLWDEPENHLHPAWQLELASVFIQLAKNGTPILLTTHSPYFLQAIRYYAAKFNIEKFVKYYSSEIDKETNLSSFVNVSDDLNSVFSVLAEPLNKIMNIDEIRGNI